MTQPTAASKPRGLSRFSKALPAVPGLRRPSSSTSPSTSPALLSHQLPPPPKDLPDLPPPPPPPHKQVHDSAPQLPQFYDKSPPLPVPGAFPPEDTLAVPSHKMSIPRRPVGGTNNAMLSPFPEPSPTASLSSLISAYSRPFESPTTTAHTGAYPDTPAASSRETSPPREAPAVPDKSAGAAHHSKLPPPPASEAARNDKDVPPAPPTKNEIWRRRPQNDSREISGLKLDYSHGSTVSSAVSIMSTSTTSTQRPATAVQDEPSHSQPAKLRKPPSVGGLPGRNVRPSIASKDEPRASSNKAATNPVQSKQSLPSLARSAATPFTNRPPTPEYQKGESRAPVVTTFTSPASPAASPESPSRFSPGSAKDLPPPPPRNPSRNASASTTPKLGPVTSSSMLTEIPRRKPATALSPVTAPPPANGDAVANKPQLSSTMTSFSSNPSRARTPQRRPPSDPRIVQTDKGPMYRGRDGTLYPEMAILREPDPRALRFPTWKGKEVATAAADGVYTARELKASHYSCFQKHAIMNRRTNRQYPLTCQTCSKANADDRWACTFCHLRICESCFRVLDANQRDLRRLVADVGRHAPLSLSSDSRPASAFGL
ncbi:uncharacterized protein LMH87_008539 [Akanthomyces muscarius]|uniref:Uncharacterized protein n=1 Tax=Akanthomyces muscarius TaxID=2231603 RepID=A0A9W8QH27_AKAMU|nr:uncharacterized protein LMH87_008539 [Akanthomyces muscarius]KAJ4157992.1 hypothetical protein LMH87_008539 [Akanthomyces muscarius]